MNCRLCELDLRWLQIQFLVNRQRTFLCRLIFDFVFRFDVVQSAYFVHGQRFEVVVRNVSDCVTEFYRLVTTAPKPVTYKLYLNEVGTIIFVLDFSKRICFFVFNLKSG